MNHNLTGWQITIVFLGTVGFCSLIVIIPFYLITRNDRMVDVLSQGNQIYLRFITVILVIWAASVLAMMGRMDEGPSAIFGMIVGYVFGTVNKSTSTKNE